VRRTSKTASIPAPRDAAAVLRRSLTGEYFATRWGERRGLPVASDGQARFIVAVDPGTHDAT